MPKSDDLAVLADELNELRESDDDAQFDLVVARPPGSDPAPWERAGATWTLVAFGPTPAAAEVRAAIAAGPR